MSSAASLYGQLFNSLLNIVFYHSAFFANNLSRRLRRLYDNPAARALLKALPLTIGMTRWGDGEFYGEIGVKILAEGDRREFFERGEVTLWPDGNAFCIFFDKTPVSIDDRPRGASPCIPLGKITKGDLSAFKSMGADRFSSVELVLRAAG